MPFVPADVFADRHRRIREYLNGHDDQALLVSDPDHFYMVTGFHLDVAPWERPVAAVFPAGGAPFLVMNELSTHHLMMATERGTLHVPDYSLYVEHRRPPLTAPGQTPACGSSKATARVNIIIVRLNGLVVENERTLFVGPPRTDLQRRAYEAATAANMAAIEKFVEGTPVAEVDAAAQQVIEQHGFGDHIMHRTGHGMGIAGHEFPEDMAFNYRPLQEHEVYSCEPGIYIYGVGGFRQDDTVVVGKTVPEVLTKRSKALRDQTIIQFWGPVTFGG